MKFEDHKGYYDNEGNRFDDCQYIGDSYVWSGIYISDLDREIILKPHEDLNECYIAISKDIDIEVWIGCSKNRLSDNIEKYLKSRISSFEEISFAELLNILIDLNRKLRKLFEDFLDAELDTQPIKSARS